jgi:hypothetical protein
MRLQLLLKSVHTRTIVGGISLQGTKSGFAKDLFEIEYGQHRMKTHMKSKTGPLRPEKYADRLMESPWIPCYCNASSKLVIWRIMVPRRKPDPLP